MKHLFKTISLLFALLLVISCTDVEKAQFADFKIPAEAAAAVSGFWAGLGTAYYAIEKDGKVLIFEGFQDEGMPEYTYKEVKSFDPKKLMQ